jgi:NAD(P)-dependent dehydrogenase (short-subunit alcohol dehydrogenase family)
MLTVVRTGRHVVVTGGGKGIGRAIVTKFVAAGDVVVAVGRDEDALAGLDGVQTAVCDVTDEAQVKQCFGNLGAVDVLVNNAGVADSAPLHRTTLADWQRQLAVNATGAFLSTRAVFESMRARGSGTIITVASTAGLAGSRYTAAYAASKHAAVGLMRSAAAELAGSGATANAVCPGFVDTAMTQRAVARIAERTGRSRQESAAALGPLLRPEQVAAAVLWLASPEAAAINGQTLTLDGGGVGT